MAFVSEAFKGALQFLERRIRVISSKTGPYVSAPIKDGLKFIQRPIRVSSYLDDTTPDRFNIQPYYNQEIGSIVELRFPVVIVGINKPIPIEIDFERSDYTAFLSVNGGPYLQSTQVIESGGTFKLRVKASGQIDRSVRVVVRAGGIEATWLVSTGAEGDVPAVGLSSDLRLFASSRTSLTFGFATGSSTKYQLILTAGNATAPTILNGQLVSTSAPVFDSGLVDSIGGVQIRKTISVPTEGQYRAYLFAIDEPDRIETILVQTASEVTNIIAPRFVHIRQIDRVARFINLHIR